MAVSHTSAKPAQLKVIEMLKRHKSHIRLFRLFIVTANNSAVLLYRRTHTSRVFNKTNSYKTNCLNLRMGFFCNQAALEIEENPPHCLCLHNWNFFGVADRI